MDLFDLLGVEYKSDNGIKDSYEPIDLIGDDGYINIPRHVWAHLNEIYTQEEIANLMFRAIRDHVGLPYKVFTENQLWQEFIKLQSVQSQDLVKEHTWTLSRGIVGVSDNTYLGRHYYIHRNVTGLICSDNFTQVARWETTDRRYKLNCRELLEQKPTQFQNGLNGIWGLSYDRVNRGIVRASLRARFFIASQFRPTTAKALYELFGAKRVLDPSAGWGDRLCGFLASSCTEHYVGIDPNTATHPKYKEQFEFYNTKVNKRADFILSGSENADLSEYKEYFDIAFTSPPYFDTERYTKEDTQSLVKYPELQNWLEGYFFPTLSNCWGALRNGGRLIININDVNDHKKKIYHVICEPMIDYMLSTYGDCTFEGVIGYTLAKATHRPDGNDRGVTKGVLGEPMFVFAKGNAEKPKFTQDIWL